MTALAGIERTRANRPALYLLISEAATLNLEEVILA